MKAGWVWIIPTLAVAGVLSCWIAPQHTVAQQQNLMDPSLTELGYIPLPDLGPEPNEPKKIWQQIKRGEDNANSTPRRDINGF